MFMARNLQCKTMRLLQNMSFKAVMTQNAVYLAINKIMQNAVCLKLAQLVQNKFFNLKNII